MVLAAFSLPLSTAAETLEVKLVALSIILSFVSIIAYFVWITLPMNFSLTASAAPIKLSAALSTFYPTASLKLSDLF